MALVFGEGFAGGGPVKSVDSFLGRGGGSVGGLWVGVAEGCCVARRLRCPEVAGSVFVEGL